MESHAASDRALAVAQRARSALALPPRSMWPLLVPYGERRWRRRLRRAPVVAFTQHAAVTGVEEIEEPLPCPLCGEERVQPLVRPAARTYHVVRCPSCGLLFRNPGVRPERLGDLYAGKYGRFLAGHYSAGRRRRYELVLDTFAPLFTDGRGRRLLDFGCGHGLFLDVAHDRGFEAWGVDLSADAVARARERPSGVHAYVGAPRDVPQIAAGGFDVVTMWSVLAHLPRPVDTLRMLRGLLAPGGVLVLLTVNANSLALKAEGERWGAFTANHVVWFSPTTLPRALARAGFAAALVRSMAPDSVESGTADIHPWFAHRLRRTIARGDRGNMLRAVAFADGDGLPGAVPLRAG